MTRKIEWTNEQIAAVAYRYNFYELGPDDDDDEDVADQPTPEELREVGTVHADGTVDIRARVICEPRLARPRAELLAMMPPATTKETTDVEVVGARGHVNAGQVVFPTAHGAFTLLPTGGYVKPAGIIMAWLNGTRCRVQMFTPGAGNNRETTCD